MSRNRGSARSTKDSDFAEEHGSQPKRPKRDVLHELGVNFNGFEQTAHRVEGARKPVTRSSQGQVGNPNPQSQPTHGRNKSHAQQTSPIMHTVVVDEDLMDCDHPEHPQGHYSAEVDFVRGITEPPGPATFSRDRLLLECRELRKEIIENMRRKEATYHRLKNPRPMHQFQNDITTHMRGILLDWLVEVAEEYSLAQYTLALACNYVDRFISQVHVSRNSLQLVGIGCMMIAAKYEEIYPPPVEEFAKVSDNTYNRRQILEIEQTILRQLDFRLTAPTCADFIAPFLCAASGGNPVARNQRLSHVANMLAELSLPEYPFWKYLPSQVAAAAVCLAHYTVGTNLPDRAGFEAFTKYNIQDLQHIILELWELHKRAPSAEYKAVLSKFSKDKYQNVSYYYPAPSTLHTFMHA